MKKLFYIIAGAIILGTGTVSAQKVGHVNSQEVLFDLPDYKKAEASMKEFQNERMGEYDKMKAKYQEMLTAYDTKKANMTEAERKLAEQDIMSLEQRIQGFEQEYQSTLEKRQQILMEPLIKQVKDAIAKVAKAQGLNYVLDTNSLLYMDGGNDITALVKKDLGITSTTSATPNMPPATPTKPGNK